MLREWVTADHYYYGRQASVVGNQSDQVPTKTVDTTLVGDIKKNAPAGNSNWQELVKQANSVSRSVPSDTETNAESSPARVTVKVIFRSHSPCTFILLDSLG
jgi:hypothetical protein